MAGAGSTVECTEIRNDTIAIERYQGWSDDADA
jgi:hypothetical protein